MGRRAIVNDLTQFAGSYENASAAMDIPTAQVCGYLIFDVTYTIINLMLAAFYISFVI